MRKIAWIVAAAGLAYSAYWFVGARGTEAAISGWLSAREAEGWQSEFAQVDTGGFPLRFDTVIDAPRIADPRTGLAFSAPRFEILSASYKPTQFTAKLAPQAQIATPYQTIALTHETAQAELFVTPGADLVLDHAAAELSAVALSSNLGWGLTLDAGSFASQAAADRAFTHDIQFSATGLAPTGGLIAALEGSQMLSDRFERLALDMTVQFDRDWDIHTLQGPRPQPRQVSLRDLSAKWGELNLKLAGTFDVDARGYPEGTVAVKAVNWREMVEIGIATGAIPQELSNIALRGGEMLAGLSGRADTIDAELTLKGGMISLGFIPLGPAPRFVIR